jgi:hypothetical protein
MGLLDPPAGTDRICRYGHGPLANVEGEWALTGIVIRPAPPQGTSGPVMFPNNKAYALKVLKCPVCGYVEFADETGDVS